MYHDLMARKEALADAKKPAATRLRKEAESQDARAETDLRLGKSIFQKAIDTLIPGVAKADDLIVVRAALQYWTAAFGKAVEGDDLAGSAIALGEIEGWNGEFTRLTGRKWDKECDGVQLEMASMGFVE